AFKFDTIKLLIENGADVNMCDNNGCTALMRSAYAGYKDLVDYLLSHGADKELLDKEGRKAVHYVREHCLAELKPILK
ncbi:MAG: ankyrin repeat domain-containing protein, partial [Erysipelotrichaceae bacterium]